MTTDLVEPLSQTLRNAVRPLSDDEIKKYNTEGYLVFRQLVSPEIAGQLHDEVMAIMRIIGLGHTKLRQTAQYLHNSLLASYVQSRLLRDLATGLMRSPAHLYTPFTAVKSGGGGGQFHFHQDGNYTRYLQGQGINLWTALVPMRSDNGGLCIVPGSHLQGLLPSENAGDGDAHRKVSEIPEGSQLIEMEPGDCVAFTRWTVHGSGPNHTADPRVAYAVQFHSEDAVAQFNGAERLLAREPIYQDIWGVSEIIPDHAGKRDGH